LWEQHQAQSLLDRVSAKGSSVQQPTPHSVPGPRQITHVQASRPAAKVGLPFCLIKDAEPHRLYKLLGQVVKLNTYDSEKTLLYITDYTENPLLPDKRKPGEEDDTGMEGDRYSYLGRKNDWPGPWGRLTIQVALWEPHAGYAREHISKDDLVLLTYVRIKQSRDLEASVHQDRIYPEKIHVQVFRDKNDERVQALMARRAEYWEIHGEPKKDTKKTKKKSQAQKKEACKEEGQLTLPAATRTKMNPHGESPLKCCVDSSTDTFQVKTKAYTAPVFPLEKILLAETHKNNGPGGVVYQLPFQNVTYRSQIKVIDFFPSKVEDFTVQTTHAPLFNTDNSPAEPRYGWEWRFCLLVEGIGSKSSNQQAREPVKIYVFGEGGEHLLDRSASE
jgi:protection-of-telomeres protein 1